MAPRKDATGPAPSASQSQQDASSDGIEEFELPRVLVTQLAKSAFPPDVKLDDDSITVLIKGSTVFISYLTAAAQDIAAGRAHKTISGADVLKALESLQFGEVVNQFQEELEVFRQGNKTKSKVVADAKGKGRDSPIGFKSAATQNSAISVVPTIYAEEPHEPEVALNEPEIALNGASVADIEMQDASGIDNHEANVPLPNE